MKIFKILKIINKKSQKMKKKRQMAPKLLNTVNNKKKISKNVFEFLENCAGRTRHILQRVKGGNDNDGQP